MSTSTSVLTKTGIADQVINKLQREIATGTYGLGDRLPPVRQLALDFGISQPTIREAIRALQSMGLVDVRHGSGVYVVANTNALMARSLSTIIQLQDVTILDVLEVRTLLGLRSAERAAELGSSGDLHSIRQALKTVQRGGSGPEVTSAITEFQLSIAAAAKNPLLYSLESFLIRLLIHFQLVAYSRRSTSFWTEWTKRPNRLRVELVDSLEARDNRRAITAMERYLDFQREQFSSDPRLSALRLSDPSWAKAMTALALA